MPQMFEEPDPGFSVGKMRPEAALEKATRDFLDYNWIIVPLKGTGYTEPELKEKIVQVFLDRYRMNWNEGVSPEEIIGDVNIHQVVVELAPMSRRKIREVEPVEFAKPSPVKASMFDLKSLNQLFQIGLKGWADIEKTAMLKSILGNAQQGKDSSIPPVAVSTWRMSKLQTGFLIGGAILVLGSVVFLAARKRK